MDPFLNIAIKAARKAGDLITRAVVQQTRLQVSEKGLNNLVTQIDQAAEAAMIETLLQAYPDHGILAEESGKSGNLQSQQIWIIDPLDGTANFIRGLPQYTVSIALQTQGRLSHAVVYHPLTQDLYVAIKGQGAQLNDHRMRVSPDPTMAGMLFSAGIPHQKANIHQINAVIQFMQDEHCNLRRSGTTALDLAYVGTGALQAFWGMDVQPWDVAAGALIVREAGGMVMDLWGGEDYLYGGTIFASTPKLIKQILPRIRLEK